MVAHAVPNSTARFAGIMLDGVMGSRCFASDQCEAGLMKIL